MEEMSVKKSFNFFERYRRVILIGIILLLVLVVSFSVIKVVKKRNEQIKTEKRSAAVAMLIEPIMNQYGLSDFIVGDIDEGLNVSFDVFADGFEQLSNGDALALLKELDRARETDDPCGGKKIQISSVNFYPRKEFRNDKYAGYYYYRISTSWVNYGRSNYTMPGVYTSNGMKCVYVCDN